MEELETEAKFNVHERQNEDDVPNHSVVLERFGDTCGGAVSQ